MKGEHATREEVQEELTRRRYEVRAGRRLAAEKRKYSEDTIIRFRSFEAVKLPEIDMKREACKFDPALPVMGQFFSHYEITQIFNELLVYLTNLRI